MMRDQCRLYVSVLANIGISGPSDEFGPVEVAREAPFGTQAPTVHRLRERIPK
jgi:hypothetical protein